MKMYLSSFRIGNHSDKLVSLVGTNKKTAVIANAVDYGSDPDRRTAGVQREIDALVELGFLPEEIDLRNYFGKSRELEIKLAEFGLIWVRGGNTFILRKAFRLSGFDSWLISQINNPDMVYAGYSAGVCVLSPSLKGLETVDDPNIEVPGYPKEIIWEGLGLIDFAFAPHYRSDHPESAMVEKEVAYYQQHKINFRALHDGEVIVYE